MLVYFARSRQLFAYVVCRPASSRFRPVCRNDMRQQTDSLIRLAQVLFVLSLYVKL